MKWFLVLLACTLGAASYDPLYAELEEWVIRNGGEVERKAGNESKKDVITKPSTPLPLQVRTRIGVNHQGIRGLFAKEDVPAGQPLVTVTGSSIINAGSMEGSFLTPSLIVLRELMHPASRFLPYINTMPKKGEIINACTLPLHYLDLMDSDFWNSFVRKWQEFLHMALKGEVNLELEWTIPEMLGNVTGRLTIEDLQYACALSSTRYVSTHQRKRLIMVPLFDMGNHWHNCTTMLTTYDSVDSVSMVMDQDVKAGDEICYSYGSMRDDYAFMHYGFLPEEEDPPRLLLVDHPEFDPQGNDQQNLSEEPFEGTPDQVRSEIQRLLEILGRLEAKDASRANHTWAAPGSDYIEDTLRELQRRRRHALRFEVNRLQGLLLHTEL